VAAHLAKDPNTSQPIAPSPLSFYWEETSMHDLGPRSSAPALPPIPGRKLAGPLPSGNQRAAPKGAAVRRRCAAHIISMRAE
jgi:hypothetical protein